MRWITVDIYLLQITEEKDRLRWERELFLMAYLFILFFFFKLCAHRTFQLKHFFSLSYVWDRIHSAERGPLHEQLCPLSI